MPSSTVKQSSMIVAIIVAAIISFGGGFAVSRYVLPVKPSANVQGEFARFAGGSGGAGGAAVGQFAIRTGSGAGGARAGAGGGFVSGEILKKDDTSMSIKMQDGSSKLVLVTSSTQALKTSTTDLSGLNVGEQVTVIGSANSDGSITAQSVQVRPDMPPQQTNGQLE
ncbi:MAG: DUF5666 domain-containing protein [Patescibacteria group bacterium]|nr:DUF5666 domain-containing protein [Patescibacteria group bacterium]